MCAEPAGLSSLDAERLFFHVGPAALLDHMVGSAGPDARADPAAGSGPGSMDPLPPWLLAAALAAAGRFGAALAVLGADPVGLLAGHPAPFDGSPAAGAVAGSVCRQLELYQAALTLDRAGLGGSTAGLSDPDPPGYGGGTGSVHVGRFDCQVGLVADHVGIGDVAEARRLIPAAAAASPGGWRATVRLAWLETEAELIAGDPHPAVAAARRAADVATAAGAPRHRAKSLLFLGVALQVAEAAGARASDRSEAAGASAARGSDRLGEASATLLTAAVEADRLGALPVAWPAWWQHAEAVGGGSSHPSRDRARRALRDVLAGLPPPLGGWLASRPTPRQVLAESPASENSRSPRFLPMHGIVSPDTAAVLACDGGAVELEVLRRTAAAIPGIREVLVAADGEQLLAVYLRHRPGLVLVDPGRHRPRGVDALRLVLSVDPGAYVVLITDADDTATPGAALAAGARGVLRRGRDGQLAASVARAVADAGTRPVSPAAGVAGQPPTLTDRELQVLVGMASGKSNSAIGRELYLSEDTVKTHARRLFRKLGARDRAEAVARGFRTGLVR